MKLKIAIVGSRKLNADVSKFIQPEICEAIISGGAKGIDSCARAFAREHDIELIEFLPDYKSYGKKAPLVRNNLIAEACDVLLAFWDGKSRGTMHTVNYARKIGKPVRLYTLRKQGAKPLDDKSGLVL